MCGIVGALNRPDLETRFNMVCDTLTHRGPDAGGIFKGRSAKVLLGHRRLSIIDLSEAANQPLDKDGLVIVFNGEIYNYKQLQEDLRALGASFKTDSDTEVVLEAWRQWGHAALNKLRGMFAFALYDKKSGQTVLARDPFGIKPLFYTAEGDNFLFASELKAILPMLRQPPEINPTALTSSLLFLWVPENMCIYKNIDKLPPGHTLTIGRTGNMKLEQYWSAREDLVETSRPAPTVESLQSTLEDSIGAHMVADVPVATFLSGGLDSSLITVLAKRHNPQLESFTIGFRAADQKFEAMPDDLKYARKLAKAHDIKLHEIELAPDITDLLPKMVHTLDEPIGDVAAINTYLICKGAREAGAKVLLSGMGGDELFGGYRRHKGMLLAQKYRNMPAFSRNFIKAATDYLPVASQTRGFRTIRWAKRFLEFADMDGADAYLRSYTYYNRAELMNLAGDAAGEAFDKVAADHAALFNAGPENMVNRMCFVDLRYFMCALNQTYTDRASMAASTEVRVPFIDSEVARAAFAMRGDDKIHGNEQKYLLKKAAEKWLPKDVIYRPKAGFAAPLRAWIRGELSEMVHDTLPNGQLVNQGFVDKDAVCQLIAEDADGKADNAQRIWQLLTLEAWLSGHKEQIKQVQAA